MFDLRTVGRGLSLVSDWSGVQLLHSTLLLVILVFQRRTHNTLSVVVVHKTRDSVLRETIVTMQ